MASPDNGDAKISEPQQPQEVLGKRKRDHDEDDFVDEPGDAIFVPDEVGMSLESYGSTLVVDDDDDNGIEESDEEDEDEDASEANDSDDSDDSNDSEDDTSADDTGHVHMEASESCPQCPIYDSNIPEIAAELTDIPRKVAETLENYDCDGKHVMAHRTATEALGEVPSTKRLRLALIGAAGVGKSSSLNGITDIANLAKSLALGRSVTCVPTEYSAPFKGQRKMYAAIIRYFDLKRIREIFSDYINDFNIWTFERDPDWDDELCQAYYQRFKTALENLTILFRDMDEFQDEQHTEEFLAKDHEDKTFTALEKFMTSCAEKLATKQINEGAYSEWCEASTRSKLREAIDPMMGAHATGRKPSLWPIVKHVCIGVRGSRVLERMTVIDLPGVSDSNETRANLTKSYIQTCHALAVVVQIHRAVDDGLTFSVAHRYSRLFNGRVIVICTRSDNNVDSKLARGLEEEGADTSSYREASTELKDKRKEISKLRKKVKSQRKLKKQTKQILLDTQAMEDKMEGLIEELKEVEARKFEALVQTRNKLVTEQLRYSLGRHLPTGKELKVFCISDAHHAAIKTGKRKTGPRLSAEATGIPALRSYFLELPAPANLRTLEEYADPSLTVFLKDLQLWVKTTQVAQRKEVLKLVRAPQDHLHSVIADRLDAFKRTMRTTLIDVVHEEFGNCREAALKVFEQKRKKHPSTVLAFIRRNGNHKTQVCPEESWNEQFIKAITTLIEANWNKFEEARKLITEQLKKELIADMRAVLPSISKQHPLGTEVLPMQRLEELVEAQISVLEASFRSDQGPYSDDLRNIRMDASQHSDKNYFSRSIQPIYDNCKIDSGKGITRRSMEKLEKHLNKDQDSSPFSRVERALGAALVKNDAKHINERIQTRVAEIFESLYASFDRLIDKSVEHPTEKAEREALTKLLPELEEKHAKTLQRMAAVKAKYTSD